jgi:hypothetical protein
MMKTGSRVRRKTVTRSVTWKTARRAWKMEERDETDAIKARGRLIKSGMTHNAPLLAPGRFIT